MNTQPTAQKLGDRLIVEAEKTDGDVVAGLVQLEAELIEAAGTVAQWRRMREVWAR